MTVLEPLPAVAVTSYRSDRIRVIARFLCCEYKHLLYRAMRLHDRSLMVHDSRKIGVGESDSAKGVPPHQLCRRALAIFAEEKAGLRCKVSMAPAIQYDPGDITAPIKPVLGKHRGELFADALLIN